MAESAIPTRESVLPSGGASPGLNPMLRVVSNSQLDKIEQDKAKQQQEASVQASMSNLMAYVDRLWEIHKRAKLSIERDMLKARRQRKGEYTAQKLQQIRAAGGSEGFFKLTETKCRAAIAWIIELILAHGTRPFGIEPTPIPELDAVTRSALITTVYNEAIAQALQMEQQTGQPINVAALGEIIKNQITENSEFYKDKAEQEAKKRAKGMEDAIQDVFVEGGFYEALAEVIDDVVTLKAGILVGPIYRKRRVKTWDKSTGNKANNIPIVVEKVVPEYERADPFDIYPAPGVRTIQDGDLIHRHRYPRSELFSMIGVPGFIEEKIRACLREYGAGLRSWLWTDSELAHLRENGATFIDDTVEIDVIECWITVPGKMLKDYGIQGADDDEREYEVNVWKCGNYIIRAIMNPDELGGRPYSMASFINNADSVWGEGVPETVEHDQDAANVTWRATVNNTGFCSGPMVEENIDRLAYGDTGGNIHPYKVYKTRNDQMASGAPAIRFYQPRPVSDQLLNVLKAVSAFADDHSGIPAFAHGNENVGGAGDTSSGLSMLMGAASRGIKNVIRNIDVIIKETTGRTFEHVMRFGLDPSVKGDCKYIAKGSSVLVMKEQQTVRRREILRDTINPTDLAIIGVEGRKKMLVETMRGMDFDVKEIFPKNFTLDPLAMQLSQMGAAKNDPAMTNTDPAGNPAGGAEMMTAASGGGNSAR